MENRRPIPVKRKLMLATLSGAVGLSLAAIIVSFAVNSLGSPQSTQPPTHTLPPGSGATQQAPPLVDATADQTHQSSLETSESPAVVQGVEHEIQLVGILPAPRIVPLDNPGDSQQLYVQGYYSDGSVGDLKAIDGMTITYTSTDPSVAEVSLDGLVTASEKGGADVEVGYGDFAATVPVLVWGEIRRIPPINPDRLVQIDGNGTTVVVNRLMVRLEPEFGREVAQQVASSIGGDIIFEFSTFPGYIVEIDARTVEELHVAIAALEADRRVTHAYADQIAPSSQQPIPETIESLVNKQKTYAYLVGAGMRGAWQLMNPDLGNPNFGVLTPKFDPVIIAVIDSDFPDTVSPLLTTEFDSGNINRPNFSTPTPALTPTSSRSSNRVPRIHLIPPSNVAPTPTPSVYPQRFLDKGRIHVFDLVPGQGNAVHGVSVTSVIVAANNQPPISTDSFSGVVTSVLGLEYDVLFYGVGLGGPKSGDLGPFNLEETTTALTMINAFENMKPYMGQIDVVNISFAADCHLLFKEDCGWEHEWHELMSTPEAKRITFVAGAGNKNHHLTAKPPNLLSGLLNLNLFDRPYNYIPAGFTVKRGDREALDNVITVGGLHLDASGYNRKHEDSNFGPAITLGAPYIVWAVDINDQTYKYFGGTSYAAPLVSGTVALLKALNPNIKPHEIKTILENASAEHPVCNDKPRSGGRCDPSEKWHKLNAGEAVGEQLDKVVNARLASLPTITHVGTGAAAVVNYPSQLTVTVDNTGALAWPFYVEVIPASSAKVLITDMQAAVIQNGTQQQFEFDITPLQSGPLELEVKLYRDYKKNKTLHQLPPVEVEVASSIPSHGTTPNPKPAPTLKPSTTAKIHSLHIIPNPEKGTMWLHVFVTNLGPTRQFGIDGKATSTNSRESYPVSDPGKPIYPRGGKPSRIIKIKVEIPDYQPGDWEVTVRLYDAETDWGSTIESKTVTLTVHPHIPTVATSPPPPAPPPPPAEARPANQEEQLLADFYNCMQRNLAFKTFIGGLTVLGDIGNPPPGSVLDDWDQFVKYYSNLFRRDPAAEDAIRDFLPVFCP